MQSKLEFSDYKIEHEGIVICEPCLTVSLFSDLDLRPAASRSVLGPYSRFVHHFQKSLRFCRLDGNQMHFKPVSSDSLTRLPREMQDDKRRIKGGVMAELMSGNTRDERLSPAIDFDYTHIGKPHTSIRIYLPLKWFSEHHAEGVYRLLDESLADFPLQAGYVGYSFLYNDNFESEIDPYFFAWLQRHPGLLEPMFSHTAVSHHGLVDLGWITLLGQDYVNHLGGAAPITEEIVKIQGATCRPVPNGGLAIQMGNLPRLGDIALGDPMDDYRRLGKLLAPLRNREALHKGMSVAGFDDNQFPGLREKWIDRFFPE